jgi:hypothetical protein
MARPLWKDLIRAREQRSLASLPTLSTVPLPPRPHWKVAVTSTVIAIAALVLDQTQTNGTTLLQRGSQSDHIWSAGCSGAFFVFGSLAVRRLATQVSRLVHVGAGPTAANALRVILTIVGLVIVVITTIIMVGVNPGRLLAAAGVTGVILGLAAQQSLGNVFAGIVLMIARPFSVGQRIRVRSGSFGGIFDGEVRSMGLTYVEFLTDDGPLRVPNLGMLASAVGPAPAPKPEPDAPRLYVNRSIAKRPRSATVHQQRRSQVPHTRVRRPREIIRRMRQRRSDGGPQQPEEPPAED